MQKILIADDNLSVLSFLTGLVRNTSYKLYTTKDVLGTLAILRRKTIDVAVVKIDLARNRTYSVESEVSECDKIQDTLVLAHSGTLELGEIAIPIKRDVLLSELEKYTPNGWKTWLESFLDDNYSNPDLEFEDVMRHFRFSKSYGHSLFKKHLNKTFSEARREVRCRNAMVLLKEMPNASIGKIAARCGFRETQRLSEAFKRLYGVSPSVYRRKWT